MNPKTPAEWHTYIQAAPNFAAATDRMQEAVNAGVDFAAMPKA